MIDRMHRAPNHVLSHAVVSTAVRVRAFVVTTKKTITTTKTA